MQDLNVGIILFAGDGHLRRLHDIEADIICLAVGRYGGNLTQAAQHLGISRSTLYRKLEEIGILKPKLALQFLEGQRQLRSAARNEPRPWPAI